jgi:hypothetical protein
LSPGLFAQLAGSKVPTCGRISPGKSQQPSPGVFDNYES